MAKCQIICISSGSWFHESPIEIYKLRDGTHSGLLRYCDPVIKFDPV